MAALLEQVELDPPLRRTPAFDQAEADARRTPISPLDEDYTGPAALETWIVHFDRMDEPRLGTAVACTPAGARTLAVVPVRDSATLATLMDAARKPIRRTGTITTQADGSRCWTFAG